MSGPDRAQPAHHAGAIEAVEEAVARAGHAIIHTAEIAFAIPEPATSRWHRAGVSARGERIFDVVSGIVLMLFVVGWTWSIAMARSAGDASDVTDATASISASLTDPDSPTAAFMTSAILSALTPLRGESGKLRAHVQQPGEPVIPDTLGETAAAVRVAAGSDTGTSVAPARAGIWNVLVKVGAALQPITDLNVITLHPFDEKQRGRINGYFIGSWPGERAKTVRAGYTHPSGFIEVTPQNQDLQVSEHFRLRDFLTHDQPNTWPKYLVLEMKLVDKLELVLSDLASRGYDVSRVRVMSGFRTPQYNVSGGDPRGRAALSRHMYGDAADIYIDADANEVMDDLNHDRRVNLRDPQVILAAVDRVEREHPELIGGAGVYVASSGHGPFIHIDTRGFRARWVGTGDD